MIAIAMASLKEALRKRIFLLVGILTIIYLVIFTLITSFAYKDVSRSASGSFAIFQAATGFMSVFGFYFSSMLVAFLTIMASVGCISSELESGVIHGIITKPLKRSEYVLGKYLGLFSLVFTYSTFLFFSIIIICTTIGLPIMRGLGALQLIKGYLFFVLQPLTILSLCIYGSTSLKTMNNGIVVIAIYILGLIGSIMEQIGSLLKNDTLSKWGIFSSLISPFDVIYRQMLSSIFSTVAITNPLFGANFLSKTVPSVWMTVYILVYLVVLIVLAVRKFGRKDIA